MIVYVSLHRLVISTTANRKSGPADTAAKVGVVTSASQTAEAKCFMNYYTGMLVILYIMIHK